MDAYTPLFAILRPGLEHVKIAIECDTPALVRPIGGGTPQQTFSDHSFDDALEGSSTTTTSSGGEGEERSVNLGVNLNGSAADPNVNRRIFALVTNVEQGYEQACILVLKRRRKDANRVKIVDGLPILPGLKASVEQVRTSTHSFTPATSSQFREQTSSSKLQLNMTLAGKTISAVSDDAQAIRDMLKVVREAAANGEGTTQQDDGKDELLTHSWMEHYLDVDRKAIGAQTPIFSRFTTSSIAPAPAFARVRAPSPAPGEVKVSYGTFNVNGSAVTSSADLQPWLHVPDDDPDILVVGLQEADSSGLSYVVWTPHVEAAWTDAIERSMQRNVTEYTKLASKQLVGVLLFVYVRTSILPRIDSPSSSSVGIGFGGWAANKGGVAIRFMLDDVSLCFVCSHLSAFHTPEALERRRWDYNEILRRLKLTVIKTEEGDQEVYHENDTDAETRNVRGTEEEVKESAAVSSLRRQLERSSAIGVTEGDSDDISALSADESQHVTEIQRWRIMDHDVVIWGGDLNFRIDLNTFETKRLIRRRQFEDTLLKFDQLKSEMSAKQSFAEFQEHRIRFPPTYKFDRGTDVYDTSEKQRCPAWTDRVLWWEKGGANAKTALQPIHYESAPSIRMSDHKPVLATFVLRMPPS